MTRAVRMALVALAADQSPLRSFYLRAQEVLRGNPPRYLRAPRTLVNHVHPPAEGGRVLIFFDPTRHPAPSPSGRRGHPALDLAGPL